MPIHRRFSILLVLAALSSVGAKGLADDPAKATPPATKTAASDSAKGSETSLVAVCDWIENNMINRTLLFSSEDIFAEANLASKIHSERTACNLVRRMDGFSYDEIIVVRQTLWDLEDGKKKGEPRRKDRLMVARCHCSRSKATGELIGSCDILSSTMESSVGKGSLVRMWLTDGGLRMESRSAWYTDNFNRGDGYYPAASRSIADYMVKDGNLVEKWTSKNYRVDPESLQETFLSADSGELTDINRLPRE